MANYESDEMGFCLKDDNICDKQKAAKVMNQLMLFSKGNSPDMWVPGTIRSPENSAEKHHELPGQAMLNHLTNFIERVQCEDHIDDAKHQGSLENL